MVRPELVAAKLSELGDSVERVRSACPPDGASLASDRDALDLVSFNLMLAVQVCVDIASHVISDEGWRPAQTLAESFARMHEHGVIEARTSEQLARAAGLRNVIAHGYARAAPQFIFAAATDGLHDLDAFAREVSAWVEGRGSRRA